ncbi:MAG: class I tRNA ligase family protein, partial [Nitrosopumilus sp.]
MVNWLDIETKWRKKWEEGKDFEADPNEKEKKFITVAYPYPNSPQHIGHGRTYTLADVHARYYRMKGYNVLFPMGFHYTGTPIHGMAKRVEAGDAEIIDGLKNIYHVPDDAIKTFVEPIKIADYFHEEIKAGMVEMGYSIDWRREFTTIDPVYQKFIEWQITTLKEKNLIMQGSHPVGWCPKDQNPVSQHDTMGDVEPDFTEYILIKFKFDDYIIPTATLRPETLFGVTNLWVNPETNYKKITVDGEKWIVSEECARKLEFLDRKISYDGEISGSDLVGKEVTVPHRNEKILMLEASFVESQTGTGLVMSVPAHAPFDYQALVDFKKNQPLGSELQLIKPISIITTDGYGEIPAKEAVEKLGISDQNDPKLEDATTEIYGKE